MNVRFAPEAAKREMTPVDNLFFTTYMPEADGMFVKVYLYGLMQCYHTALQDEEISDALDISETDVRTAFVYWQAKGLVRIDSEEPFVVEYMLADLPSLTTATDLKYRPFVRALQAVFAPQIHEKIPQRQHNMQQKKCIKIHQSTASQTDAITPAPCRRF